MEDSTTKIKVQKRTPTEKQLEALEKARVSKQKKKTIKEHTNEQSSSSFLAPPPYLTGLILLGFAGLGAYSLLKGQKNSPTMEQDSVQPTATLAQSLMEIVVPVVPLPIQMELPVEVQESPKQKDFFSNSTKL